MRNSAFCPSAQPVIDMSSPALRRDHPGPDDYDERGLALGAFLGPKVFSYIQDQRQRVRERRVTTDGRFD
jgi:hypothetical protein